MAFCTSCGKELGEGAKFCGECGALANGGKSQRAYVGATTEKIDMSIWQGYVAFWEKYAIFSGRARRKEYWGAALFGFIAAIITSVFDSVLDLEFTEGIGLLGCLYFLAAFIPSLSIFVRRLHDIGKSGWNYLWLFFPIIGWIMVFVWLVREGTRGENNYGPDPKGL